MSNQLSTVQYSPVDGITQDVDMPDAGLEQSVQGGTSFLCAGQGDRRSQGRQISVASGDGHVDYARTSLNDLLATNIQYFMTPGNHVQDRVDSLEYEGVLHHLRAAKDRLKLGANSPDLNDRRFLDREGDEFISVSTEHKEAFSLLCTMHDFLSSDELISMMISLREFDNALYHLSLAQGLLSRLSAQ